MSALVQNRQLLEAILDSGIQNTNFFNGRILAAGDLQTDQEANREQHEQLGLAVGAGIVRGFWVELANGGADAPAVSVGKGLAFNGVGQAVSLPIDVQVALTRQSAATTVDAGLFADCAPPTTAATPLQAGFYILTATPTSGFSGQAPMLGFGDAKATCGCGSRYAVEGALFRLVPFDPGALGAISAATRSAVAQLMTKTDSASLSKLRNWVAHICFGTEELARFARDPFALAASAARPAPSAYLRYGAIDALIASSALTRSDVPLALLYWTVGGVQFVDCWSVRRQTTPELLTARRPVPLRPRRRAEAEATFLQFEDQVQSLLASSLGAAALANLAASDYFRYLPPAAILPSTDGVSRGLAARSFFAGLKVRDPDSDPLFAEGAKIGALLAESLDFPPIDLSSQELIWIYRIRENQQAIDVGAAPSPQPFVLFANGQIECRAAARLDLTYFGYGNYA